MIKKNVQVANFNVVFGENELPMLDYFDMVIYPALSSGIAKKKDEDKYLFKNIEIVKNLDGYYVLRGVLVKKTILEIKSDLNEMGDLIEKDEKYPSAPYSLFAINLMNHRMIFMPNQKGSPTLANFRSTVKYVINTYIKFKNKELKEENKIDYALVNVVGIPSARSMDALLKNVKKISSLTLRFYPLNGDVDYSEVFGVLTTEVRSELDCKNGEIVYKSPKSIEGVKKILEKAAGTIDPILKVVTNGGSTAKLKDYELSEKYELDFDEDSDINAEKENLTRKMTSIETLNLVSDAHCSIYKRNEDKIIRFYLKRG